MNDDPNKIKAKVGEIVYHVDFDGRVYPAIIVVIYPGLLSAGLWVFKEGEMTWISSGIKGNYPNSFYEIEKS